MKILLVVPAGKHLRVSNRENRVPKRSMLRFSVLPVTAVAGATPAKHQIRICDENVEPLDFDADVDVVGISLMTATANRGREIAAEFRKRGKIAVAGGYHATLCPEDILGDFDSVVVGDAEGSWPRLLEDVEAGRLKRIYKDDTPPDLSKVPRPRRDLTERTAAHYVTTNAVQVGRGCRHGCKYCSVTAFHKHTYRRRPIDSVLDELRSLPKDLIFVDDNIIADPEYAKRLFEAMIPLKKRWVTQCSLDIADDEELLRLARKAGCRGLFIGIETIRADNLKSVGKGFNKVEDYKRRISAVRRSGIGIIAGIIVGMDGDDVTVFERTLKFLQELGIGAVQVNIMTPLPGTPLFDELKRAGRIADFNWDHFDFRHAVIDPKRMSARELQDGADWLYRSFYRLDRVILRTLRTLFVSGPVPAYLAWRLNMTYAYDNRREKIVGKNPARTKSASSVRVARRSKEVTEWAA